MIENNVAIRQKKQARKEERLSTKIAQSLSSIAESTDQVNKIKLFNNNMEKQNMVSGLNDRIDRNNFGDVLNKRTNHDAIIKVRCTKPSNESLNYQLVRKKSEYEYTEVVFSHELIKFGYNEWMQI